MATLTDSTATVSANDPTAATTMTASDGGEATGTLVAMTTPFSIPPDCLGFDGAVMDVYRAYYGAPNTTQLTQNIRDMDSSSCWPSGAYRGTYSPAVCPTGWTYYSIMAGDFTEAVTVTTSPSGAPLSTTMTYYTNQLSAYCCPSGFTMAVSTWSVDSNFAHACSRTVSSGDTTVEVTRTSDAATTTFQGTGTLVIPTPLTVFWHQEDASMLTPQPPDIPDGSFAPSWLPGQTVVVHDKIRYDDSPRSNRLATGVFAAVIAVPIVIFLAILGCCICCFRIRRKREKREIAKEQEESQALAVERTSTQERTLDQSTDGGAVATREPLRGSDTAAAAAATGSSTTARQASSDAQRPAAETLVGGNPVVHSLSEISKPPYPGLPSQGFDGIEEPPPYVEAAPSYSASRRSAAGSPTSPTQEHTAPRDGSSDRPAA
ncbi:hypothetical protein LMH87_005239 [Akanthomyces muscarius]|uniref:Uncharacterized protein n=1 Tax=Akanthomyces muscarius TaxID=2231603 RepID=A0A9W8QNR8_AKAMU|nr:hypothetical protein LMH87_005239 [Akanthomyces muscarius]KAJ4163517.1 hypothetical protein LMH87_005239 [Akanthomyces muscarius]